VLLKLIEEPPEKTIFLLVAEDSDSVLNTIISRTQLVRIPPIDEVDMVDALIQQEGLDSELARKLAVVSSGNYWTALELIQVVENPFLEPWKSLLSFGFTGRMEKSIEWAEELSSIGREGLKSFFLYGLQLLRFALLQPYGVGATAWNSQEADLVKRLSGLQLGADRIQGLVHAIENSMYEIERNGNIKMILVDVSYQVSKWIKKS
jgi:DNA polymerase-3 subunit delta'